MKLNSTTYLISFFLFLFSFTSPPLQAQNHRICISQEISRQLSDSLGRDEHYKWEEPYHIDQLIREAVLVIPVVVHIIHDNGSENIPDHKVHRQIRVLNEDFGKKENTPGYNEHEVGADTRIRFALARKDPDGNPTSGIIRVRSALRTDINSNPGAEMQTKNLSRWDSERYLNIWVVRSINMADHVLGYAYLPSTAAGSEMDGIVINHKFFGGNRPNPQTNIERLYNGGRVATHEAGHYLNLLHTWGGDGRGEGGCNDNDRVHDTPVCDGPFESNADFGCPAPEQCGNIRMIENYMDYSTDACMNIFTAGQKARMRDAAFTFRSSLISIDNLHRTGVWEEFQMYNIEEEMITLDVYPNPVQTGSGHTLNLALLLSDEKHADIEIYSMEGRIKLSTRANFYRDIVRLDVSDIPHGMYIVLVKADGMLIRRKIAIHE
jgi:hypothetical protein